MDEIRRALGSSQPSTLVFLVRSQGSTPRHAGARFAVFADGSQVGSIGGGRVEWEVVGAAQKVAVTGQAQYVKHHLVRDLAMCCGGTMEFLMVPTFSNRVVLEEACQLASARQAFTWSANEGGVIALSNENHEPIKPTWSEGMFRQTIVPPPRIILLGAGHVAGALGPVLASLGFDIILCDDNETGSLDKPISWASETIASFSLNDVASKLGVLGKDDYVIITTRDHAVDEACVEAALRRPTLTYVGLIASESKRERFRKRILAKGFSPEDWSRLHSPIGLPGLLCETPQEIAVSVAADLLHRRRASA